MKKYKKIINCQLRTFVQSDNIKLMIVLIALQLYIQAINLSTEGRIFYMELPNMDLRNEAKAAGVALWRVAAQMSIHESTLSRKLRNLTEAERVRIRAIIAELKEAD